MSWEYFSVAGDNLACPHCGECHMDDDFMGHMVGLRRYLGFPLQGTSGYRCPHYNSILSPDDSLTGPHTTGRAMDVTVSTPTRADQLIRAVMREGSPFTGIGAKQHGPRKKRFFHIDDMFSMPERRIYRPRFWTYP